MIQIPIITGPTACGKTSLSLALSQKFKIELISADAYQVYRKMNIGTAKPDSVELATVPHHLIDFLDPQKTYSAGDFFEQAESLISNILSRNHLPVIIGGTAMYVDMLVKGIFKGPSRDDLFRDKLELIIKRKGLKWLYRYLYAIDPVYAQKISENDQQRIIRAIEVYKKAGMPFSEAHQKLMVKPQYRYELFILEKERSVLYEDINQRVVSMFNNGWVEEVKVLMSQGIDMTSPSFKAIGYREIADYVSNTGDLDRLIQLIQKKTRNFAKRQLTWFRHMENARMISYVEDGYDEVIRIFEKKYNAYAV